MRPSNFVRTLRNKRKLLKKKLKSIKISKMKTNKTKKQ